MKNVYGRFKNLKKFFFFAPLFVGPRLNNRSIPFLKLIIFFLLYAYLFSAFTTQFTHTCIL